MKTLKEDDQWPQCVQWFNGLTEEETGIVEGI